MNAASTPKWLRTARRPVRSRCRIAANLALPTGAFIDGKYCPAISGRTFETVNPATGEKLADIAACRAEDVDLAVEKAREASCLVVSSRAPGGGPCPCKPG